MRRTVAVRRPLRLRMLSLLTTTTTLVLVLLLVLLTTATRARAAQAPSQKYALASLALSKDYVAAALVVCRSARERADAELGGLPPHLELVVNVPSDAEARGIDVKRLACCFQRVVRWDPVHVVQGPSFERFKEQYVKLRLWLSTEYTRIAFMDADFLVLKFTPLFDLLRSPVSYGAVKDFYGDKFVDWWNGGFLVMEPSEATYDRLISLVDPYIVSKRFDPEQAEQAFLSAAFDKRVFTLPSGFNLNLAILYRKKDMWDTLIEDAVAIHFTLEKPWQVPHQTFPFNAWREVEARAVSACPAA